MDKCAAEKSNIMDWDNKESEKKGCFEGLLNELGDEFKGLLENGNCRKRNRALVFGYNHIEESSSEFNRSKKRFREISHNDDNDEEVEMPFVVLSDDDDSVCAEKDKGLDSSSENQETLSGMLKWLTSVAKCPHDPSIGVIPHWSKWKEHTRKNKYWIQTIRAKKALMVKRDNNAGFTYQNSPLLVHQTMHPSMFEDYRTSTGRLRCSLRRPCLSNGSPISVTKSRSSNCRELDLQVYSNEVTEPNKPEIPRRYVAVGRHFQAIIDEWTGSDLDSDTKWLGTSIWPLGNEEEAIGNDLIGKGRPDCCSCDIVRSGSVECIRFHIAEKRMELKRDLGDVFFHWRFNQMGEEVSLRWTEREEKRFKEMMISDPQTFWGNAKKGFRGKKREQLVSYYFNVFLINRRRYQNRVTPRNVDSDDEGSFGCVGNSFGHDAVTSIGSEIMICSQNSQCNDLD